MKRPSISVLLLDLGGVVLDVDLLAFPRGLGIAENMLDTFQSRLGTARVFVDFETGAIDRQRFYRNVLDLWETQYGPPPLQNRFVRAWRASIRGEIHGVREVLTRAKESVHLMALSNTDCIHMDDVIRPLGITNLLEKVFTSYEIGHRKPDAAIYEQALSGIDTMTGGSREQVLFIDDRDENVLAARHHGIHAELCQRGPGTLDTILRRYGI